MIASVRTPVSIEGGGRERNLMAMWSPLLQPPTMPNPPRRGAAGGVAAGMGAAGVAAGADVGAGAGAGAGVGACVSAGLAADVSAAAAVLGEGSRANSMEKVSLLAPWPRGAAG